MGVYLGQLLPLFSPIRSAVVHHGGRKGKWILRDNSWLATIMYAKVLLFISSQEIMAIIVNQVPILVGRVDYASSL